MPRGDSLTEKPSKFKTFFYIIPTINKIYSQTEHYYVKGEEGIQIEGEE